MAISPPAKVKIEPYAVLAYGIDTLYLAIYLHWEQADLLEYLEGIKEKAKEIRESFPGEIKGKKLGKKWVFHIKEYGANGYAYVLHSLDMTMLIGDWKLPKSRPSLLVEFRSEFLWKCGPEYCVDFVREILTANGAENILMKPSRLDLCVDMLLPDNEWNKELGDRRVSRARKAATYEDGKKVTGFSVGRGTLSARLYDKALEIKQQSKKEWMYHVWRLKKVPKGMKVIRVEFQVLRQGLKEVGVDFLEECFENIERIWTYLTRNWLKYQTPGKHHTQRKTLPFWIAVQDGFAGSQEATPAIRQKRFGAKREQLVRQAAGVLTTINAMDLEEVEAEESHEARLWEGFNSVWRGLDLNRNESFYSEKVSKKRAQIKQINTENQ